MKRFTTLAGLDKPGQQPRKSGQAPTEESLERDRKFAERAAAIEKLKKARIASAPIAEPAPKAPAKTDKD
jgi:hypothetical protein